jgi:threonylcarbamoyladenosine tRNA methylthiotransferase MtaB
MNTCTVTDTADSKSLKIIRQNMRNNPKAIFVVMGCFAQLNKDTLVDLGVQIILGNHNKSKVLGYVKKYLETKENICEIPNMNEVPFDDMKLNNFNKTRAFVKIEDGCENFCSYCIIPYTRGKCRSKDHDTVLDEINCLVNNGYQEIVLTGIHTGHYGEDSGVTFPSLLTDILKIKKLKRLRISSIEITELNDDFIEVFKNSDVIVPHLHIPLQAGSDEILKSMNRKYDLDYYRNKIKELRSIKPDLSITTDIIVGFPGETDEMFNSTLDFAKEIGFSKIHVFPYSRRKGTKADLMPDQIDERIKKERVSKLIELSNELEHNYLDKFINKNVEILVETIKDGVSTGHTGNYLEVKVNKELEHNKMYNVIIKKREENFLIGELYEN